MRKLLRMLLILLILIPSNDVYAEETKSEEYNYSIEFFAWDSKTVKNELNAYYVNGTIKSNYKMCAYKTFSSTSGAQIYLFLYDNSVNFIYEAGTYMINLKQYITWSGTYEKGYANMNGKFLKEELPDYYKRGTALTGILRWDGFDYINGDNPGFINTNIPIFSSREEMNKFIAGDLTEKDSINYESDLCKIVYDLETPQNMKAVQDEGLFSGAMKFTWTQSAEGYEEWETEFYVFEDFKYRSSFLTLSLADWKYAENFYLFTEYVDTRKLYFRITEEIFEKHDVQKKRSDAYPCDYGGYYDPLVDTYYIRNHYFDGELHHYSNWVVVTFDYESGDIVTNIKEVSGSEIEVDDSGNVVVGESEKVQDSQYDDDYDVYSKESSSDIVNFIKSGFGLLGEDGVLTLLSQTFSFIPSELWSVFIAGMALMVIIAVAKFVRG